MFNFFKWQIWVIGLLLHLLVSCNSRPKETLFVLRDFQETGIDFTNQLTPDNDWNILNFRYYYNGGGVGIGDVNGDGLPDVLFTGNQVSCKLYLNQDNLNFLDITTDAGITTDVWATGVTMVDINADGLLDIYVCVSGDPSPEKRANLLFINQGNNLEGYPQFEEKAALYGLNDTGYSTQAAFFDYDRDGDLDAYLLTAANGDFYGLDIRTPVADGQGEATDKLYRNNGDQTFTDVSSAMGITTEGFGLGIGLTDINVDGWPDIYVANDYLSSDFLYINNGDSSGIHLGFTDKAAAYLQHQSHYAMGMDIGDINRDTQMDLYTLDMWPAYNEGQKMMAGTMDYDRFQLAMQKGYMPQYMRNMLQLNRGKNPSGDVIFSEIGQFAGVHQTDWSWSALLADFNQDGWLDIHVTNGYVKDITNLDFVVYDMNEALRIHDKADRQQAIQQIYAELPSIKRENYCFINQGDLTFAPTPYTSSYLPSFSNGAAYSDLDRDGDLDLVINNINQPAFILENQSTQLTSHHYLQIRLAGPILNPEGIGARIQLQHGDVTQIREQYPVKGYQSSVDPLLHVGLGKDTMVSQLEIWWSDGAYQQLQTIAADQAITLTYTDATHSSEVQRLHEARPTNNDPPFQMLKNSAGLASIHKENTFADIKFQPLLLQQHSTLGPGLATGDVDDNGWDDIYVGGAFGQSGMLYLQQPDGNFLSKELTGKNHEDVGALLFDSDQDGDKDLYLVSGGALYADQHPNYQDRLYINDGSGNLSLSTGKIPNITSSGSCAVAADYDQDGDLDLFVGGRVVPGSYPLSPRSYLLNNTGGSFEDVTETVCPQLKHAGMVSQALWTDINQDTWIDLIIVGEGIPIRIFQNQSGSLVEVTEQAGLAHTTGWWNSVSGADMDRDGDIDYVIGNIGRNIRYTVSTQQPLYTYTKDFDQNGMIDAVSFAYQSNIQGKYELFPIHSREKLVSQLTYIKRQFPRFQDYASASLSDVFDQKSLQDVHKIRYTYTESVYMENLGEGTFSLHPLPNEAQFAPVFGSSLMDVDQDGYLDIILTGNFYGVPVEFGRYDALTGCWLRRTGNGQFVSVPNQESGLWLTGDTRAMVRISTPSGEQLIVSQNNDALHQYLITPLTAQSTITVDPNAVGGRVYLSTGEIQQLEFYYGSGYISQSSRNLILPEAVDSLTFYDSRGYKLPSFSE